MLLLIPAYKRQDLEFAIFLRNASEKELEELKDFLENCESVLKNGYRILYNVKDFHIMGQANLMVCLFRINSLYDLYNYEMWESTTERVSQEVVNADGYITKTNVFVKLRKYGC